MCRSICAGFTTLISLEAESHFWNEIVMGFFIINFFFTI